MVGTLAGHFVVVAVAVLTFATVFARILVRQTLFKFAVRSGEAGRAVALGSRVSFVARNTSAIIFAWIGLTRLYFALIASEASRAATRAVGIIYWRAAIEALEILSAQLELTIGTREAVIAIAFCARMLFGARHTFAILAAFSFARTLLKLGLGACRSRKAISAIARHSRILLVAVLAFAAIETFDVIAVARLYATVGTLEASETSACGVHGRTV